MMSSPGQVPLTAKCGSHPLVVGELANRLSNSRISARPTTCRKSLETDRLTGGALWGPGHVNRRETGLLAETGGERIVGARSQDRLTLGHQFPQASCAVGATGDEATHGW